MSDITERLRKWKDELGYPTAGEMLDEAAAEIARLTAEVGRHRMTEEERVAMDDATAECDYDNRAMALRNYLARTAQKEVGRE